MKRKLTLEENAEARRAAEERKASERKIISEMSPAERSRRLRNLNRI